MLILPYVGGSNQAAEEHCVSFEAPERTVYRDAAYARHVPTADDAQTLAWLPGDQSRHWEG